METAVFNTTQSKIMTCVNCNSTLNGKFCSNCGSPQQLKRVDSHYIIHEIQHVLHLEKGFLYTIKELLIAPGRTVRQFIINDRSRLVKPVLFIILTSLLYTLVSHYFHTEEHPVPGAIKGPATNAIITWITGHYGYANILMGIIIAIYIKLLFSKYDYNLYEILILLCFVMGMGMLVFAVFGILQGLMHINFTTIAGLIGIGYCIWAIGQFFNPLKPLSYIKALIAYISGMVSFWAIALLLGYLLDSI